MARTSPGQFIRQVRQEVSKVVPPTWNETLVTSGMVFIFVFIMAIFFYAVVYTMWLKRWTPQNIVIGGAAGAFPPMIGWAAATGTVSIEKNASLSADHSPVLLS